MARSFPSQVNEIHARVAVLNRFTEIGRPLTQVTPLNLAQLGALCIKIFVQQSRRRVVHLLNLADVPLNINSLCFV